MNLVARIIDLAERGYVPDFLLRAGIRRLCRKRLAAVDQGSCEANQKRLEQLVTQFNLGPVAPLPEKANEQHYEVPSELYELVLGARRKYSCCVFPTDGMSLDAAEEAALRETCERAGIEDGQNILELGCGWGSLTLWMAEHYPDANITAVSNSASQREYILAQAKSRGIDRNLEVITCDMNDFDTDTRFDRVVSVEMFEHMRNYRELFKRISNWLKSDGKLFVHIFCHREFTYEFEDNGPSDWMSRYFFSGGVMPGDNLLLRFSGALKTARHWRWSGTHYQKTSEAWLANMDRNRKEIMPILERTYGSEDAERWFHRWRLFYLAVAELFGMDNGQQWWVSHYLFEKTEVNEFRDNRREVGMVERNSTDQPSD
ncbi:MAG: cyclopropane-fatty-acyl-phospholipid synthase family protein [Planctomycetota bacterium]